MRRWPWLATCVVVGILPAAEDLALPQPLNAMELSSPLDPAKPSGYHDSHSTLGLGPLRLSSQSPGQSLRLGLIPHTPADLATGEMKAYIGSSWVNVWANHRQYALDYESLTSEALLAYGINSSWAFEVGALSRVTFGGHLDGVIQRFHEVFGIDQDGRDTVPQNQTSIRIDPNGTQPGLLLGAEELDGNRTTFLRGALLWTLSHGEDGWPATALAATLQAPIGDQRGYSGGLFDVSLDLSLAKPLGDWVGYATVTCTRFAADQIYGIHLHRTNWAGFAAIEYRVTSDWSLVLQYLLSQGVAPDLYVFSEPSHEVTLGTQVRVGRHTTLQLGLIENVFIFDNSPDFGVHLALEMRL
jgi:hypothetical protein